MEMVKKTKIKKGVKQRCTLFTFYNLYVQQVINKV